MTWIVVLLEKKSSNIILWSQDYFSLIAEIIYLQTPLKDRDLGINHAIGNLWEI